MPAGLHYLSTGRFDVYRVNPPLTRLCQAVPALLAGADTTGLIDLPDPPGGRTEWGLARDFADRNRDRYLTVMRAARLPGLLWSLAGCWLACGWARELYGERAVPLLAVLWSTDPFVLAHATLATPDLPCAVMCLAAVRSAIAYFSRPDLRGAIRCGFLVGVAQLTKFTALADYVSVAMLAVGAAAVVPQYRSLPGWTRLLHAGVVVGLSVAVLNLGYGCEGFGTRLGQFDFVSRSTTVVDAGGGRVNRFAGCWAGRLPVPLPSNYLRGLDLQQVDFEGRIASYLAGQLRQGGWWYFYLYGLAVKTPGGTLLLAMLGIALAASRRHRAFSELAVWVPVGVILAAASAKTGVTLHLRYVLPAWPFVLVGLSKVATCDPRLLRWLVTPLAAWAVAAGTLAVPHSLSYFNELAGGAANGADHLIDSNLDWGQDLLELSRWASRHPQMTPLHVGYDSPVGPETAGLAASDVPTDPRQLTPGWYALDVQSLYARDLGHFRRLTPTHRVGNTFLIYHLTDENIKLLIGDK